jgi:O6-methylguanine-DNA--protein-cysteine methyltransferase
MAHNPFVPLVPCHRVVRATGETGGYVFGQAAKIRLLAEEGVTFEANGRVAKQCFKEVL